MSAPRYAWRWDCRACNGGRIVYPMHLDVESTTPEHRANYTDMVKAMHEDKDGCASPDLTEPISFIPPDPNDPDVVVIP